MKRIIIILFMFFCVPLVFGDTFTNHLTPKTGYESTIDVGTLLLPWGHFRATNGTFSGTVKAGGFDFSGSNITTTGTITGGTFTDGTFIVSDGIISAGTWQGSTITVPYGGTGSITLTDGGLLVGSGTSAITALSVLADGSIIVGDGATEPVALAAFTSSTGDLKHEAGGLEADVSGYTDGLYGMASGVTADIDTIAELETAIGGTNILIETEIDASSELLAIMDDETGTGVLVFGTSPTFTTSVIMSDGATLGQAAGPLITFDDTGDDLEIFGCNVGIGTTDPWSVFHIVGGTVGSAMATLYVDPAGSLGNGGLSLGAVASGVPAIQTFNNVGLALQPNGGDIGVGGETNPQEDIHAADTIRADVAFNLNGTDGVSGTLVLDDGTTERITLVFTGGILTSRTVAAASALLMDWTD